MSTVLFSYWTVYKVGIGHTPFQFVYGLHPLLPIKYMLPYKLGENRDPQPIKVTTNWLSKLEKLQRISW